jgi:hypothetical protein
MIGAFLRRTEKKHDRITEMRGSVSRGCSWQVRVAMPMQAFSPECGFFSTAISTFRRCP